MLDLYGVPPISDGDCGLRHGCRSPNELETLVIVRSEVVSRVMVRQCGEFQLALGGDLCLCVGVMGCEGRFRLGE